MVKSQNWANLEKSGYLHKMHKIGVLPANLKIHKTWTLDHVLVHNACIHNMWAHVCIDTCVMGACIMHLPGCVLTYTHMCVHNGCVHNGCTRYTCVLHDTHMCAPNCTCVLCVV